MLDGSSTFLSNQTTRRYSNLHSDHRENLKSHVVYTFVVLGTLICTIVCLILHFILKLLSEEERSLGDLGVDRRITLRLIEEKCVVL